MEHGHHVYGLDIETDTSLDGLDPHVGMITSVALSVSGNDRLFQGPERELLIDLDRALRALPPGLLATWNGGAFDLPYLADRASLWGIRLGLVLAADPRLRIVGPPLRGHDVAYRGQWYRHRHIDAARLTRGVRMPFASTVQAIGHRLAGHRPGLGLPIVDDLSHEVAHAFPTNDARLARVLVERQLPKAARHVDRVARNRPALPRSPAHPAVRARLAAQH